MSPGLWLSKDGSAGYSEKKKEEKVDRRRGGKAILKSGQGWTSIAQLRAAEDRTRWKGIVIKSYMVRPVPPGG